MIDERLKEFILQARKKRIENPPPKNCPQCGRIKEYPDKELCIDCYYKNKGYKQCIECHKYFKPSKDYHSYCDSCFKENKEDILRNSPYYQNHF